MSIFGFLKKQQPDDWFDKLTTDECGRPFNDEDAKEQFNNLMQECDPTRPPLREFYVELFTKIDKKTFLHPWHFWYRRNISEILQKQARESFKQRDVLGVRFKEFGPMKFTHTTGGDDAIKVEMFFTDERPYWDFIHKLEQSKKEAQGETEE